MQGPLFSLLIALWSVAALWSLHHSQPPSVEPEEQERSESLAWWASFWERYNFVGEPAALLVDPVAKRHFRQLCPKDRGQSRSLSILLPLAGTGDELEFFQEVCSPVDAVFGVEIDALPIAVFFQRLLGAFNASSPSLSAAASAPFIASKPLALIPPQVLQERVGGKTTYCYEGLCFLQKDFFQSELEDYRRLSSNDDGKAPRSAAASAPFDAVFDRRAFSAVAPALRQPYVKKLAALTARNSRLLITILLLQRAQEADLRPRSVPPFPLADENEVRDLFSDDWEITAVLDEVSARLGVERVYLMTRR